MVGRRQRDKPIDSVTRDRRRELADRPGSRSPDGHGVLRRHWLCRTTDRCQRPRDSSSPRKTGPSPGGVPLCNQRPHTLVRRRPECRGACPRRHLQGTGRRAGADRRFSLRADFHNGRVDVFDAGSHHECSRRVRRSAPAGAFRAVRHPEYRRQNLRLCAKQDDEAGETRWRGRRSRLRQRVLFPDGTFVARAAPAAMPPMRRGDGAAPAGPTSAGSAVSSSSAIFGDGAHQCLRREDVRAKGHLKNTNGKAVVIDGLWGIAFREQRRGRPRPT